MTSAQRPEIATFLSSATAAAVTLRLVNCTDSLTLLVVSPLAATATETAGLLRTTLSTGKEGSWERVLHGAVVASATSYTHLPSRHDLMILELKKGWVGT
jgi:hypothetical protein